MAYAGSKRRKIQKSIYGNNGINFKLIFRKNVKKLWIFLMDLLVKDLQWAIARKLEFADFMKSRKFFENVVSNEIYTHYHKSAMVIQKNILKRRIIKNGNLCWLTKFNYHNINGKMLYFIIRYDNTFARSETIIPKMDLSDNCHRCCP